MTLSGVTQHDGQKGEKKGRKFNVSIEAKTRLKHEGLSLWIERTCELHVPIIEYEPFRQLLSDIDLDSVKGNLDFGQFDSSSLQNVNMRELVSSDRRLCQKRMDGEPYFVFEFTRGEGRLIRWAMDNPEILKSKSIGKPKDVGLPKNTIPDTYFNRVSRNHGQQETARSLSVIEPEVAPAYAATEIDLNQIFESFRKRYVNEIRPSLTYVLDILNSFSVKDRRKLDEGELKIKPKDAQGKKIFNTMSVRMGSLVGCGIEVPLSIFTSAYAHDLKLRKTCDESLEEIIRKLSVESTMYENAFNFLKDPVNTRHLAQLVYVAIGRDHVFSPEGYSRYVDNEGHTKPVEPEIKKILSFCTKEIKSIVNPLEYNCLEAFSNRYL